MTYSTIDAKAEELAMLADFRARLAAIRFMGLGVLEAIVVAPRHGAHEHRFEARVVPRVGVEGDRPYKQFWRGRMMEGRQISAINAEVLDALGVGYEVTGDNLVVRGVDLASFEPGETIRIGDAVLLATGASHNPCKLFKDRTSTAHYVAIRDRRQRGTMFDALNEATIRVGDPVERIILERPRDYAL